jgi:MerR family transcriptional regulator, copper efflux regulator
MSGSSPMATPARLHLPLAPEPVPGPVRGLAGLGEDAASEQDDEALLQVGDLAKAVGKSVRAIHLYEELGLLRPHTRSKGRYRLFDAGALVRVRWIAKLQDLGLSLSEIQSIVREWERAASAPRAMRLMRETYRAKLAESRAQIARLRALETELAASLNYLETCDTCDPARLLNACMRCDQHGCDHHAPDLVAGFHAGHRAQGGELVAPPEDNPTGGLDAPPGPHDGG